MMWWTKKQKRIYLDYAAATPVSKAVRTVMEPYACEFFSNPGAIHCEGVIARKAVEDARTSVARTLRVRATDVTFTASGTESNNIAILGRIERLIEEGVSSNEIEVISTRIEHPSIMKALIAIEKKGVSVLYLAVSEEGFISKESLQNALSPNTRLVTFAYANSEVGTIQNVRSLVRIIQKYTKETSIQIPVHIDAAQAPLWLPCQLDSLGVSLMSLDAGKCHGPKGVGVLVCRQQNILAPIQYGGGQESGLRSGTENVAGIVGAAVALKEAQSTEIQKDVSTLRDYFIEALHNHIPNIVLNGPAVVSDRLLVHRLQGNTNALHRVTAESLESEWKQACQTRLANNINVSIPGIDTEFAVVVLDAAGVSCSTKSACSGATGTGSAVVKELVDDIRRETATLRFSLGPKNTRADVDKTVAALATHVAKTRAFLDTISTH